MDTLDKDGSCSLEGTRDGARFHLNVQMAHNIKFVKCLSLEFCI